MNILVKIAVCDDSPVQIELMKEYFNIFEENHPGKTDVSYFGLGAELLENALNGNYDIYIVDIIMPEINGIELARTLRQRNDKGKILFLTASKDYVFDAFNVKASDYLIKPVSPERFFNIINQLIEEIEAEVPQTALIKTSKGEVSIRICDILYIENVERSPVFYIADGRCIESIAKRGKFSEIISDYLNRLSFSLCGVSIAVNLAHVYSFKRDSGIIYLDCGKELYCSRLFTKDFKNALNRFRK